MPFVDPAVHALKMLCDAHGGYKAVAEQAEVSAENLSQILAGTLLPSGNPRGIGARLKVKLTQAYPGWLTIDQSAGAWQTTQVSLLSGADGWQYTAQSPALTHAQASRGDARTLSPELGIEAVATALLLLTESEREVMAGKLASLARAPDSPTLKRSISDALQSTAQTNASDPTRMPDFLRKNEPR